MQVQYRENKGGFECIHLPSIDMSSIDTPTLRQHQNHQQQISAGSGEASGAAITNRPSIVKKASKLSFGMKREKGKDREHSTDKSRGPSEHVGRTSVGTTTLTTSPSRSSSFFNVPSHQAAPISSETQTNGTSTASETGTVTGTKTKILPPIPRDFGARAPSPLPARSPSPFPTGEVDRDVFESMGNNTLSVRFEINIVKVRIYLCITLYTWC